MKAWMKQIVARVVGLGWPGLPRLGTPARAGNVRAEALLLEGERLYRLGKRRAALVRWREAAMLTPYDERVWFAILRVAETPADRHTCVQNILAINPFYLNAREWLK